MKLILATVCMAGTAMAFSGQSFIPGEPLEGGDSTAVADEINSRLNSANAGMCTFRLFVCVTQKIYNGNLTWENSEICLHVVQPSPYRCIGPAPSFTACGMLPAHSFGNGTTLTFQSLEFTRSSLFPRIFNYILRAVDLPRANTMPLYLLLHAIIRCCVPAA